MGTRWRLRRDRRIIRGGLALLLLSFLTMVAIRAALPLRYTNVIRTAAAQQRVQPALVAAVIRVESGYRPAAVSPRGAIGMMQLMPATAKWIAGQNGQHQGIDLMNPRQNIFLGTWYLAYLLRRYHQNLVLALAAYNGGPGTTDSWLAHGRLAQDAGNGSSIPYPETRHFVARVLRYRRLYRLVYGI